MPRLGSKLEDLSVIRLFSHGFQSNANGNASRQCDAAVAENATSTQDCDDSDVDEAASKVTLQIFHPFSSHTYVIEHRNFYCQKYFLSNIGPCTNLYMSLYVQGPIVKNVFFAIKSSRLFQNWIIT
jgi:hypothetical protein